MYMYIRAPAPLKHSLSHQLTEKHELIINPQSSMIFVWTLRDLEWMIIR